MKRLFSAAAPMIALLAAGCSMNDTPRVGTASAEGKQCFWPSQVSGFNRAGRDRIYVHTGPSEVFLFETLGSCPDLNWTENIALKFDTPGTVCSALEVDLLVPTSIGVQRCPVRMISKLPEEEARAM